MRKEQEIWDDINAIRDRYHESHGELTVNQISEHNTQLEALQMELSDSIAEGANPCACGNAQLAPMGMVKTPAHIDRGVEVPAVYEVGCVHCPPFIVEREDGYECIFSNGQTGKFKRRSLSARAFSPEQAVENWNSGKWVEDNLFDRNIPVVSATATQDADGVWHLAAV